MTVTPQIPRLLRLIDELESPVVQVWGWPGSGRAALLAALLGRGGALGLAPEDLATPAVAREAVRRVVEEGAGGGMGLVLLCPGLPEGGEAGTVLEALGEAMPVGSKLVVATGQRLPLNGLLGAVVTPRDLALRPEEVVALWRQEAGKGLTARELDRLVRLTDGWWRVLGLVAGRAGVSRGGDASPVPLEDGAALVRLPEVTDFLRLGVLAELTVQERAALADPVAAPDAVVARLRDRHGLLLEQADGTLCPPAPLAALLARDRSRDHRVGPPPETTAPRVAAPGFVGEPAAVAEPVTRFRLRLLGHPEVLRQAADGSWQPVQFSLKRGLRLLGYLATSPERTAPRDELTEALWPETDREVIERNFHPTLSRLRRDLRGGAPAGAEDSGLLILRDDVYLLDPRVEWWIDLRELGRLWAAGRDLAEAGRDADAVERWKAAWRLYRGPLLDGIYDPWANRRREGAQRRHLVLLRELGAAYERLGNDDDALDAYRALLVDDPLEERVHVALMRLYAARGRRDLVRRQYERLSLLLRTELGVEPLQETAEEYHRLMIERG